MQALWSRAGQAHLCACRGCLQGAAGMMRQSTTRATRRKPTFGEVFTAFYTSIMGTAAILDAKRKDTRRKELERQLNEVKADLEKLMEHAEPNPEATTPPPGDIQNRYKGAWKHFRKQEGMSDFFDALGDVTTWQKIAPRSTELDTWWSSSGLGVEEEMAAKGRGTDYDYLLHRLRLEESNPYTAHRVPRTSGLLALDEGKTRSLILRLLNERPPETTTDGCIWGKTKKLLENDAFPCYKRTYRNPNEPMDANRELNRTLRAIMDKSYVELQKDASWDIRNSLYTLCHNLLVAPHPITIHTLATLILGFDRMGQHSLANLVVCHFLYVASREPTQQFLICLLNHYKEQGNIARFYGIILRCTGSDARGIKIRRKALERVEGDAHLQSWARVKDVVIRDGFVIERAWFGPDLLNVIVDGFASLGCLRQAVATLQFCWGRGIGVGSRIVVQILTECMRTFDDDSLKQAMQLLALEHPSSEFSERSMYSKIKEVLKLYEAHYAASEATGATKPILDSPDSNHGIPVSSAGQAATQAVIAHGEEVIAHGEAVITHGEGAIANGERGQWRQSLNWDHSERGGMGKEIISVPASRHDSSPLWGSTDLLVASGLDSPPDGHRQLLSSS